MKGFLFELKTAACYYLQCPKERKTFLSPSEEEQLIRRLYASPKVNLYPPTLYEDLPPLKFWNSPASTIENYLRRKVFHKRLQMAYEFNQTKDPSLCIVEVDDPQRIGTAEQLSKAMKQLAEDRDYFELLEKCTRKKSEQSLNSMTVIQSKNKAMWDLIKPLPKTVSLAENVLEAEVKLDKECKIDIRKRFYEYQDFYRLRNLRKSSQQPLAVTIGSGAAEPKVMARSSFVKQRSVGFNEYRTDFISDLPDDEKLATVISERSILKSPQAKEFLLESFHENPSDRHHLAQTMRDITDVSKFGEKEVPELYIYEGPARTAACETLLNARDSFQVTHEKLSRVSNSVVPKTHKCRLSHMSLASHKDSITVRVNKMLEKNNLGILQGQQKTTSVLVSPITSGDPTFSHEDSILLAIDRMRESKDKAGSKLSTSCICNNQDRKSIQFMCPQHPVVNDTDLQQSGPTRNRYLSILSKSTFLSAKDSLVVAHRTATLKDKRRHSIGCQVEEGEDLDEKEAPETYTVIKGSRKQKFDEQEKNSDVKMMSSKLRNYLLESIQIVQVIPKHD